MIKVLENISLLPLGIFLPNQKALVISDIHIGFEAFLSNNGIQLPKTSYLDIRDMIERYIDVCKAEMIIINGDLKEDWIGFSYQEVLEVKDLIQFLKEKNLEIKFVKGNHDTRITEFLIDLGVDCYDKFLLLGDTFLTHGHLNLREEIEASSAKRVIIGHEHASIVLKKEISIQKFKAIASVKLFDKDLYILPAFSPLKPGYETNSKEYLSPILRDVDKADMLFYVYEEDEWFTIMMESIKF